MQNIYKSSDVEKSDSLSFIRSKESLFSPMLPVPTDVRGSVSFNPEIKAVLFDIYGTLLISEAGDIGLSALYQKSEERTFHLEADDGEIELSFDEVKKRLSSIIGKHHNSIKAEHRNIKYPEVDIISVWSELYRDCGFSRYSIKRISRTALHFEILSNKVALMPGAEDILLSLNKRAVKLGIVSNAQFYTPLLLNYLWEKELSDLGFQDDFSSWSYQLACGKPDPLIFSGPIMALNRSGIENHEILYIGNDMLNDVSCAASFGLKTVLFAGDKRSLRLREGDSRVNVSADYIITELKQIDQILQDGM